MREAGERHHELNGSDPDVCVKAAEHKDLCIETWQGRISEITEDEDGNMLVCIQWDSITLKNMPGYFIEQSEEEGLDYTTMCPGVGEVELTEPRDAKEDTAEVIKNFEKILTFPFDAKVLGYQNKGPLRSEDKVSVKRISLLDEDYGIIVELRRERKKYDHPLSDLEVINEDSINYQPVKDYRVWFANR